MRVIINLTSNQTADEVDGQAYLSAVMGGFFCHAASSNVYQSKIKLYFICTIYKYLQSNTLIIYIIHTNGIQKEFQILT